VDEMDEEWTNERSSRRSSSEKIGSKNGEISMRENRLSAALALLAHVISG